jgi:hypothetical protein
MVVHVVQILGWARVVLVSLQDLLLVSAHDLLGQYEWPIGHYSELLVDRVVVQTAIACSQNVDH